MLYTEYFVPNFLSKCQFIWVEDNMFSICQEERGGVTSHVQEYMDVTLEWIDLVNFTFKFIYNYEWIVISHFIRSMGWDI